MCPSPELPPELWLKVAADLGPQDLGGFAAASKGTAQAAQDNLLWKEKLKRHFPQQFAKLANAPNSAENNWYQLFKDTEQTQYARFSPRLREIFSLFKERDLDGLKTRTITGNDLCTKAADRTTLIQWLIKNQGMLDSFFQQVLLTFQDDQQNISPKKTDNEGASIFHWAIFCHRSPRVLEDLLTRGCDINAPDQYKNSKRTPIEWASWLGDKDTVEFLLQQSSAFPDQESRKSGVLLQAAGNGHMEIVKFLLEQGANINQPAPNGVTPLYAAARNGHVEVVKFLHEQGANINQPAQDGTTPLWIASRQGQLEVVKFLSAQGATYGIKSWGKLDLTRYDTPLCIAAGSGHVEVVDYWLSTGKKDVEKKDNDQQPWYIVPFATPLYAAAREGQVATIKLLLDKKADINGGYGRTPLYIAAALGHLEAVKILLAHGADVSKIILKFWGDDKTPLFIAAERGHTEIVKALLENGANINQANRKGSTPLCAAAKNGEVDMVKLLLEKGAKVNKTSRADGITPLYAAVWEGHLEVVKILLNHEADIHQAAQGTTPLYIAAEKGHFEIVKLLLEKGANINQEKWGTTPLSIAAQSGHVEVVEFLLQKGARFHSDSSKPLTPPKAIAKAINNPAIKSLLMKAALSDYITRRTENEKSYKHFWGGFFGGYARDKKLAAAEFLKTQLDNAVDDNNALEKHHGALSSGELGDIYKQFQFGR